MARPVESARASVGTEERDHVGSAFRFFWGHFCTYTRNGRRPTLHFPQASQRPGSVLPNIGESPTLLLLLRVQQHETDPVILVILPGYPTASTIHTTRPLTLGSGHASCPGGRGRQHSRACRRAPSAASQRARRQQPPFHLPALAM